MKLTLNILLISVTTFGAIAITAQESDAQVWGRIAFYAQTAGTSTSDGTKSDFNELVTAFSMQSAEADQGLEYATDFRVAGYPGDEDQSRRVSLYSAYVGHKFRDGALNFRAGQMWLNELGALGSIGGGLVQIKTNKSSYGQLRFGAFGGMEPKILELGYVENVYKMGGFAALDGENGRSHILGYVNVRNTGVTERSVLVFTNFLPVGQKFFLYQAAEYDLTGPTGGSGGGLNYFFTNARYSPNKLLEFQGNFNHGRSIDYRTITLDEINGRPVDDTVARGFLFESVEGRVSVTVAQGTRVYAGYSREQSNEGDDTAGRLNAGFYSGNFFKTGMDVQISTSRTNRSDGSSYNSWNASAGRMLGEKFYLSGEYSSSLSIIQFVDADNVIVQTRPSAKRYGISVMYYMTRAFTILINADQTNADSAKENRIMGGVTYRF